MSCPNPLERCARCGQRHVEHARHGDAYECEDGREFASAETVEPLRDHNGGFSTDATDPEMVKALARRIIRPLRERAKVFGYALAVHGSLERDIDLIAVPWTDEARAPERLARGLRQVLSQIYPIGLEVPPNDANPKPHGRVCWSWWIRPWTYIDLAVFPPTARSDDAADDSRQVA